MKKNWRPNPFFAHKFAHLQFSVLSNSEFNYSKSICFKWPEIQNLSSLDILKATHKKKLEAKPFFAQKFAYLQFSLFSKIWDQLQLDIKLCFTAIYFIVYWIKNVIGIYIHKYNHWKSSSLTNVTPWKLFKFPFFYCSCSFWYLLVYT